MAKYRLYIDESGTHSYSRSEAVGKRYLALTGVIISEDEVVNKLQPALVTFKRIVTKDPNDRITLHREEIANRIGPYSILMNPDIERVWNQQLLELIDDLDFTLCTVVIDKNFHRLQYTAPMHPYHYGLYLLLERYVTYLEPRGGRGDVMAEARGKNEDRMLQEEYSHIYTVGTSFVKSSRFQQTITSNKLKLKPKDAIAGLELADLLVLASNLDVLMSQGLVSRIQSKFMAQLIPKLQPKYYRNPNSGRLLGYGKKFLGAKPQK